MFRIFALAAPAAALALTAGTAQADEFVSNGRTAQVYHGDLDLTKVEDQQRLRSRIARAASRVCSSSDRMMALACKSDAIAHVDAPMAAAIARAENGARYADAGSKIGQEPRAITGN